jgi:hypothetical protein
MFLHVESTQHHPNHAQSDRITDEQKSLTLSSHGYFDGLSILFRVRILEDFVTQRFEQIVDVVFHCHDSVNKLRWRRR